MYTQLTSTLTPTALWRRRRRIRTRRTVIQHRHALGLLSHGWLCQVLGCFFGCFVSLLILACYHFANVIVLLFYGYAASCNNLVLQQRDVHNPARTLHVSDSCWNVPQLFMRNTCFVRNQMLFQLNMHPCVCVDVMLSSHSKLHAWHVCGMYASVYHGYVLVPDVQQHLPSHLSFFAAAAQSSHLAPSNGHTEKL